jgi:hypothetical protein
MGLPRAVMAVSLLATIGQRLLRYPDPSAGRVRLRRFAAEALDELLEAIVLCRVQPELSAP